MMCGLACPIFTWKMICGIHAYYAPTLAHSLSPREDRAPLFGKNNSCASHYTGASWRLKPPSTRLFVQRLIYANIIALYCWSLARETTGDRGIPHTKGQFHAMMSSWLPPKIKMLASLKTMLCMNLSKFQFSWAYSIVSYYHMRITLLMRRSLIQQFDRWMWTSSLQRITGTQQRYRDDCQIDS